MRDLAPSGHCTLGAFLACLGFDFTTLADQPADALTWIHQDAPRLPVSGETIQRLHAMAWGPIWDAGRYKEKDGDIIERTPDGLERGRFRIVPAKETPAAMARLIGD